MTSVSALHQIIRFHHNSIVMSASLFRLSTPDLVTQYNEFRNRTLCPQKESWSEGKRSDGNQEERKSIMLIVNRTSFYLHAVLNNIWPDLRNLRLFICYITDM